MAYGTETQTSEEAMNIDYRDITVEMCEAVIPDLIADGEWETLNWALRFIAVRDPAKAQSYLETLELGIKLAKP